MGGRLVGRIAGLVRQSRVRSGSDDRLRQGRHREGRSRHRPVYGRAYPEATAYPSTIAAQAVTPIEYTIPAGQAYVLTDAHVTTDYYYYAKTFNGAGVPDDRTDVTGTDRYLQVNIAHRVVYVRAADVDVASTTPRLAVSTNATSWYVNGKPRSPCTQPMRAASPPRS